jgi:dTDP-4-dehydrorhamnose 3,5-epimerase
MTSPPAGAGLVSPSNIPGLVAIPLTRHEDARGSFLKAYHAPTWAGLGIDQRWQEAYFSWSQPGVVRGLHFQVPPHDHAKSVVCLSGRILDVIVDLRLGSPTECRTAETILEGDRPTALHIPTGCAHGFAVLGSAPALVAYLVSSAHEQSADAGILWSSVPASWPTRTPTLSGRDGAFPPLNAFASPFRMPA